MDVLFSARYNKGQRLGFIGTGLVYVWGVTLDYWAISVLSLVDSSG